MRKYYRPDNIEEFRRVSNQGDVDSSIRQIPAKQLDQQAQPAEKEQTTAKHTAKQARPVKKVSCAKLVDQLDSIGRDREKSFPITEKLSKLIAGKEDGWEPAVDTLIEWMGHEDNSMTRKHSAFYCLKMVLEELKPSAEVRLAVVVKLQNAKNDEHHPYREGDAGKLLARASSSPSEAVSIISKGSTGSRQGVINILNLMVSGLAAGSPAEAASAINIATPVFLDILSEKDDGRDSVGLNFDKAAVLNAFTDWAEKMPDETLDALLRSGSKEEEKMWVPDEKRGPFAAGVILNYIAKEQPDIAGRLAKHILIKGKFSHLTAVLMRELGDSAIKPVIDEGMTAGDKTKLYAAGFTLAMLGPKALESLFDYMTEKGDEKTLMRGFGMLAGTLQVIASGSSQSTIQIHLGGLEKTLRENVKFKSLVRKAMNSGDDQLVAQAQSIQEIIYAL